MPTPKNDKGHWSRSSSLRLRAGDEVSQGKAPKLTGWYSCQNFWLVLSQKEATSPNRFSSYKIRFCFCWVYLPYSIYRAREACRTGRAGCCFSQWEAWDWLSFDILILTLIGPFWLGKIDRVWGFLLIVPCSLSLPILLPTTSTSYSTPPVSVEHHQRFTIKWDKVKGGSKRAENTQSGWERHTWDSADLNLYRI